MNQFIGPNLEMRLVRRLLRWDLRERTIHSGSVVYDCTFISHGHIYQNAAFMLREEFQGKNLKNIIPFFKHFQMWRNM